MVIGGIVAVVAVAVVTAGVVLRRRSHDDVHSVEHYHRQLHTLEEMRTHPPPEGGDRDGAEDGRAAYPAATFRVGSGSPAVRLTEPNKPLVPPVPPPPVPHPAEPVTFDDHGDPARTSVVGGDGSGGDGSGEDGSDEDSEEPKVPALVGAAAGATTSTGIPPLSAKREERALHAIDHRPRRLGAPLAAIGVVAVLIVVLIVTGLHTTNPPHHGSTATTVTTTAGTGTHHAHGTHEATTTTTTAPPVVSAPSAATNHDATYQVALASYSLALSATNGECWIQATEGSGSVLFTGILYAGQSHTVPATGPVTVIAGAPNSFSAAVNGAPVTLPAGFQAPFTLKFVGPGAATGGGTGTGTGTQSG
jgi:hypothetical protein